MKKKKEWLASMYKNENVKTFNKMKKLKQEEELVDWQNMF